MLLLLSAAAAFSVLSHSPPLAQPVVASLQLRAPREVEGSGGGGRLDDGWSRGAFGKLAFSADWSSYSWSYGGSPTVLNSYPGSLANVSGAAASSGSDAKLGAYDELALSFAGDDDGASDGSLAVRYFGASDAFLFLRFPATAALPSAWPEFSIVGTNATNATKCLGWAEHYFFPGQVLPRRANTNPRPLDLRQCGSGTGGPLFLFDTVNHQKGNDDESSRGGGGSRGGSKQLPAFAMSALSHFTSQAVTNCPAGKDVPPFAACRLGVSARAGGCGARGTRCQLFNTTSLLLARPGLTRATRAFGALLRRFHGTARKRAAGVTQLSYWSDNQAGYSWWTAGDDQSIWGTPEDIYLKLKAGYDAAGIPVRGWEPDNNWNVSYLPKKNWKGREWSWNETLYPSGGEAFVSQLGNLSMTYYTNGFVPGNAYEGNPRYAWTKAQEPHPNASYALYSDIIGEAARQYGMQMLFTDFLCFRGPAMQAYQDVGAGEEGGHKWLAGMTDGAAAHGVEVQYCMAEAHQILESAEFGAVTNARVNGDGGLDVGAMELPALLAATAGLGWSKDNLRTADRCYVNGTYPNGTVKWPCGSINGDGEGTSGQFKMQLQQTMFAALSLGPVGIADQLSARPDNPSADITSNKTLVMATCAATGDLLQPSYPLVPLDRTVSGALDSSSSSSSSSSNSLGVRLWGTYTALGTSSAQVWYTAMAFCLDCQTKQHGAPASASSTIVVYEADLAPMVDVSAVSPSFADVPAAPFLGEGASFDSDGGGATATAATARVAWTADIMAQSAASGCANVAPTSWVGELNVTVPNGDGAALLNIAPVFGKRALALLGEVGKIAAVSTYRFSSVALAADGNSLQVALRGKPGETVSLLFAVLSMGGGGGDTEGASFGGYKCHALNATIGASGVGAVDFSGELSEE